MHASVEAGSDSAAISGAHEALIQAALAAQETGSDSAAIALSRDVAGSLAAQEIGADSAYFAIVEGDVTAALAAAEQGGDRAAIGIEHAKPPQPPRTLRHHMTTDFPYPHVHVQPFQPTPEQLYRLSQKLRIGHHQATNWPRLR